jgi:CRP/FNR family transcriptional regulator, dissimilatory nitrate respiration regulator
MHLVIAGQVKLFLPAANGAEMMVHMAGPGETFGEEAVAAQTQPVCGAGESRQLLLLIDKPALIETMRATAIFPTPCCRACANACALLIESLETCLQLSSAQRVVQYLTQQASDESGQLSTWN